MHDKREKTDNSQSRTRCLISKGFDHLQACSTFDQLWAPNADRVLTARDDRVDRFLAQVITQLQSAWNPT